MGTAWMGEQLGRQDKMVQSRSGAEIKCVRAEKGERCNHYDTRETKLVQQLALNHHVRAGSEKDNGKERNRNLR